MGLRQRFVQVLLADAHHKFAAEDAAGHVAVEHEAQTAEHLLLAHARPSGQQVTDAAGKGFVVGHPLHPHPNPPPQGEGISVNPALRIGRGF